MKQEIYISSNKYNTETKKDYSKECEEKHISEQNCSHHDCEWCLNLTPEVPFSKQYPYGLGEPKFICTSCLKQYIIDERKHK